MIITFELEGISFNATKLAAFSKEKFMARCLSEGYFSNYSKGDQKKLINQAFIAIKAAVK